MRISRAQARKFILDYHQLSAPRSLRGKEGIMNYFKKVGCIQYDPLNMVGYNSHLVLQSRVRNYRPQLLNELLYQDRRLMDGWDKCMSIYEVDKWPYFTRVRNKEYSKHAYENNEQIQQIIPEVRDIIGKDGPVSSKDLDFGEKVSWYWGKTKAARAALESLYATGELIVSHKVGTRKYYDLADKHIGQDLLQQADPNPSDQEYFRWYVKRRIGSLGLIWDRAGDGWQGIRKFKSPQRKQALNSLLADQQIIKLNIEGIKQDFFIRKEDFETLQKSLSTKIKNSKASFIAPLDNVVWDRRLIKELFNFDYKWEVYTPPAQRKYGYYVLPVLYRDRFVARIEPQFNSKTRQLIIKNWWWEDTKVNSSMLDKIDKCLASFKSYLGADEIIGAEKIIK